MSAARVAERLRHVYDPDLGLDIVALGLVYGIELMPGQLRVRLTTTSAECPLAGAIVDAARDVLRSTFEGFDVEIDMVQEPPWDPWMMDGEARRSFGLA